MRMEFVLIRNFSSKVHGDTLNVIMSFFLAGWKFPAAAHHKINSVILMEVLLFNKMEA